MTPGKIACCVAPGRFVRCSTNVTATFHYSHWRQNRSIDGYRRYSPFQPIAIGGIITSRFQFLLNHAIKVIYPTGDQEEQASEPMDDLDRQIIHILEDNGRASNARIAREVGVSEGTVRRRLNRLVSESIIKVVALPDPKSMGYESEALIGIQVDPDKIDECADSLAALSATRWVAVTTGSFDMFAWVVMPDPEHLGRFLRESVGRIPGVRKTETFVNLTVRKREFGLPI